MNLKWSVDQLSAQSISQQHKVSPDADSQQHKPQPPQWIISCSYYFVYPCKPVTTQFSQLKYPPPPHLQPRGIMGDVVYVDMWAAWRHIANQRERHVSSCWADKPQQTTRTERNMSEEPGNIRLTRGGKQRPTCTSKLKITPQPHLHRLPAICLIKYANIIGGVLQTPGDLKGSSREFHGQKMFIFISFC